MLSSIYILLLFFLHAVLSFCFSLTAFGLFIKPNCFKYIFLQIHFPSLLFVYPLIMSLLLLKLEILIFFSLFKYHHSVVIFYYQILLNFIFFSLLILSIFWFMFLFWVNWIIDKTLSVNLPHSHIKLLVSILLLA